MATTFIDHATESNDLVNASHQFYNNNSVNTDHVEDDVRDAFEQSPILGIRQLQVEECDGSILISGKLCSFYHKQLAQEVVRNISPKSRVVNSVEVKDE